MKSSHRATRFCRAAAFFLVLLLASSSFAAPPPGVDVARSELESASDKGIVFVSYEGPQSRIDSAAAIKAIGTGLGQIVSQASGGAGDMSRYGVIRAIDPTEPVGFDADILVIGPGAQIDHIRNLRWVIAAYLTAAWGYSDKDAATLSVFVTVYNAVHRLDAKYVEGAYKKIVQKALKPDSIGLSTMYSEWPGKTMILIPLGRGAAKGKLGAVDTGAVASKDVTKSLQGEPDKGIGDRQAMTDIKEREAAALRDEAAKKQAEADKAAADLAAQQAKVAADRAKLEADKAAADKAGAGGAATTGGATAGGATTGTGAAQSGDLTKREAEVKAAEAATAAKEAEVAAKQAEAAKTAAAAETKTAEAATDRTSITADQKTVIAAEVAAKGQAAKSGIFFFQIVEPKDHLARIVLLDGEKGGLIRASRVNAIHLRGVTDSGDGYVAIAGKEGGTGLVHLVKIDKTSLEVVTEGKSDMFTDSMVLKSGEAWYAIVKEKDGSFRLARFDATFAETARSKEAVEAWSLISVTGGGIAVQKASGGFAILDTTSLALLKTLNP